MSGSSSVLRAAALLAASAVLLRGQQAHATAFAAEVMSYTAGTGTSATYQNPSSALGKPDEITGEHLGFPNVLNPFSPAFEGDEIAQIGEGGHLTLRLSNFAIPNASGPEIGVFENVSLIDDDYPNGVTIGAAGRFGADSALVEVSADGSNWRALDGTTVPKSVTFDQPATYYRNAIPSDVGAPFADFGIPFTPSSTAFDNKSSYTSILSVFGMSAGGTWIDISNSGLSKVGYIRFSVPDDGTAAPQTLELDAVSVANNATGAAVPEPAVGFAALALLACVGRRRA